MNEQQLGECALTRRPSALVALVGCLGDGTLLPLLSRPEPQLYRQVPGSRLRLFVLCPSITRVTA